MFHSAGLMEPGGRPAERDFQQEGQWKATDNNQNCPRR